MHTVDELNDQQRRAVQNDGGPLLIVAGPGTGKTKTLTTRIAYLLETKQAIADAILALTFTVKAAREMRERVARLLGNDTILPTISTFHALCLMVLQVKDPSKRWQFVSEAERLAIIRSLPKTRAAKGLSAREISLRISQHKSTLNPGDSDMAATVGAYDEALNARGLIDFDDLLLHTHRLLSEDTVLRGRLQQRYSFVLVDEFQDTSQLQWQLVKLLLGNNNICVIGDPNQSIYSFRGASSDMFAQFRTDFPDCKEITLTTNYRSAQAIVKLGNAIFPNATSLTSYERQPGSARAILTLNEYSEADFILRAIEQGIGGSDLLKASVDSKGRRFRDFAVLYRTHHVAKTVQKRLHDSGIPFQVVGEGSPYDYPEVRAVIDSLRWLGRREVLPAVPGLRDVQAEILLSRLDVQQPVSRLASQIIETLGLEDDDAFKRQRLSQLQSTLVRFDTEEGLDTCIDYFERISQSDFYDQSADAVTLLTIHASKGLEFTHVFLIATEQGYLPNIRKTGDMDIEEERRLFYVAATRAKQELDILHAKKRSGQPSERSQFIEELPDNILPQIVDPELPIQQKRLQKRQQKGRQTTLF